MSDIPALSIVVPCYNEELVIAELLKRVRKVCATENIPDYEVILIDDGSSDNTAELIKQAHQENPHVVGVILSRNHGHQVALTAGLSYAKGARILVLDADLQDPPELLGQMMAKMDEGYDVVYGRRLERQGETPFKKATAHVFYRLLHGLIDIDLPTDTGDFRLMSRRILDIFLSMPEQDRFIRGMVSWIGLRQTAVEYNREARFAGETKYPLKRMLRLAVDAFTGFSIKPLRIATYMGFLMAFFALLLGARVFYGFFSGSTVPGWTSLMLVVLIISSVQLVVVGIMGEYIGRLYMQSKARPLFIVDQVLASQPVQAEVKMFPEQRTGSSLKPLQPKASDQAPLPEVRKTPKGRSPR